MSIKLLRSVSIILALAVGIGFAACGNNTTVVIASSVSADIKADQGGTIKHGSDATVAIPPHALSADATVTLTDAGAPPTFKGDPFTPASDRFKVSATGKDGKPITLLNPLALSLTSRGGDSKKIQDEVIVLTDPTNPNVARIHGRGDTKLSPSVTYDKYNLLDSYQWLLNVPILSHQPTPTEGSTLEVPWYYQDSLPWCVPTSMTDMMRYYDFTENSGDPLNATFGQSTALANWQTAAQNHQSAGGGAGLGEVSAVGMTDYWGGGASDSVPGVNHYIWDDDFLFTPPNDNPSAVQHLHNLDFVVYVTLVNTGLFGLVDRKPVGILVDTWNHAEVIAGVAGDGIYLHNPNTMGAIAQKMTWTDFANSARAYVTDDMGHQIEVHGIETAVVYGFPTKPEAKRRGSIVIAQHDLSYNVERGTPESLTWDGANSHTYGYYFSGSGTPSLALDHDLGIAAFRSSPLHYQYRIANVTNVMLTYNTVEELSVDTYGNQIQRHNASVTVAPYAVSDVIAGVFNEPTAGNQAIFDVKLRGIDDANLTQDVKFIRYNLRDSHAPVVSITSPANNAHVYTGSTVTLAASSNDPDTGQPLPNNALVWKANGNTLGTGADLTTSFAQAGTVQISLTGTNASGQSSTASSALNVDTAPYNFPASVSIDSPADKTTIYAINQQSTQVTLAGSGSKGMQFTWSDNTQGTLGTGPVLSATLNVPYCVTTHVITLTGVDDQGRKATASITLYVNQECIK